jgi:hypothetical protein
MGRRSLARSLVIALTLSFVMGAAIVAQTETQTQESQTQPKKKKVAVKPAATAQPQSGTAAEAKPSDKKTTPAESAGKGKAAPPKDPKDAGWQTVQGRVVALHPEQHSLIIQATNMQYQVYITPQTQLIRDGQPADMAALKVTDRVDQCHFNAKHVIQTLKVTSAERVLQVPASPEHK